MDAVCTHVADIDFGKMQLYTGNYTFWYESSQLALRQQADQNKKVEDKRSELQEFVRRFSANASKSKQATSRKKLLEKLVVDEIKPSTRRYPGIIFKAERDCGDQILQVDKLSKSSPRGDIYFSNITFTIDKGDKVAFLSRDHNAISSFFDILMEKTTANKGLFLWGSTIAKSYLPNDNTDFFSKNLNLIEWLQQYSSDTTEVYMRGFLGKMLFSGEESLKKTKALSGGEKVRCMIARMMLTNANCLILDEPTNHIDIETITAFNNVLKEWKHVLLFSSRDHEFTQTLANRIIELTPDGIIDKHMSYDEYLADDTVKATQAKMYFK